MSNDNVTRKNYGEELPGVPVDEYVKKEQLKAAKNRVANAQNELLEAEKELEDIEKTVVENSLPKHSSGEY